MAVSMNQSCEVKESPETRALRVTGHLPPSRASHRPGVRSPPAAVPERGPGRPEDTRLTKALAQGKTPPSRRPPRDLFTSREPSQGLLPTLFLPEFWRRWSEAHLPTDHGYCGSAAPARGSPVPRWLRASPGTSPLPAFTSSIGTTQEQNLRHTYII